MAGRSAGRLHAATLYMWACLTFSHRTATVLAWPAINSMPRPPLLPWFFAPWSIL